MADGIEHHRSIDYAETEFDPQEGFSVSETPEGLEIAGVCPACGGRTRFEIGRGSPQGFKGIFRRRAAEPRDEPVRKVTVFCACGHMHAERPPESIENGCGAFWTVELP